ncbi:monofunctional biosynthetic peptidoglycan transglycosylase [Ferrovibrio sp.]|uniref:monofunctional biosynthetic peptidoglycan transglycosylase n=1 Tax=Ferrovibrio sp. TaxID=1917215 RepID=UPI001B656EB2|nr:monofunctional biosynthetic peptidoglycan transglycosylase [Ferrovibrio sp.]MBP7064107.1 monofunctional biosynthetic peptidoglycan transglycosylase [Ferrovibrio sp.]
MRRILAKLFRFALLAAGFVLGLWLLGLLTYRWVDPPATPLMGLRALAGETIRYRPLPLIQVAPSLALAVVASEDARFCQHAGIDLGAVRDAIEDYQESGRLRGASTITMQVARNLFLWPGGGFVRKGLEVPLALAIDALWPKQRILEIYLGIAEMGPGLFGAEAAAQAHFGRPAAALTAAQAARLAAILPNPNLWSAARPTAYIERRAAHIQGRMAQLGPAQINCFRATER